MQSSFIEVRFYCAHPKSNSHRNLPIAPKLTVFHRVGKYICFNLSLKANFFSKFKQDS